jgi:hypothetical protein
MNSIIIGNFFRIIYWHQEWSARTVKVDRLGQVRKLLSLGPSIVDPQPIQSGEVAEIEMKDSLPVCF